MQCLVIALEPNNELDVLVEQGDVHCNCQAWVLVTCVYAPPKTSTAYILLKHTVGNFLNIAKEECIPATWDATIFLLYPKQHVNQQFPSDRLSTAKSWSNTL